ncbi:hypothetical protein DPMN_037687 [Dreissena polymorpha]|uniref:Uncharacterized protein n=1 Tax=Dreissena polymorpha TaxID=45954 RepID=A0A9D4MD25_DREPO|nr:hypothetical protein DPMN_037687 [Dreissena polymorpha]
MSFSLQGAPFDAGHGSSQPFPVGEGNRIFNNNFGSGFPTFGRATLQSPRLSFNDPLTRQMRQIPNAPARRNTNVPFQNPGSAFTVVNSRFPSRSVNNFNVNNMMRSRGNNISPLRPDGVGRESSNPAQRVARTSQQRPSFQALGFSRPTVRAQGSRPIVRTQGSQAISRPTVRAQGSQAISSTSQRSSLGNFNNVNNRLGNGNFAAGNNRRNNGNTNINNRSTRIINGRNFITSQRPGNSNFNGRNVNLNGNNQNFNPNRNINNRGNNNVNGRIVNDRNNQISITRGNTNFSGGNNNRNPRIPNNTINRRINNSNNLNNNNNDNQVGQGRNFRSSNWNNVNVNIPTRTGSNLLPVMENGPRTAIQPVFTRPTLNVEDRSSIPNTNTRGADHGPTSDFLLSDSFIADMFGKAGGLKDLVAADFVQSSDPIIEPLLAKAAATAGNESFAIFAVPHHDAHATQLQDHHAHAHETFPSLSETVSHAVNIQKAKVADVAPHATEVFHVHDSTARSPETLAAEFIEHSHGALHPISTDIAKDASSHIAHSDHVAGAGNVNVDAGTAIDHLHPNSIAASNERNMNKLKSQAAASNEAQPHSVSSSVNGKLITSVTSMDVQSKSAEMPVEAKPKSFEMTVEVKPKSADMSVEAKPKSAEMSVELPPKSAEISVELPPKSDAMAVEVKPKSASVEVKQNIEAVKVLPEMTSSAMDISAVSGSDLSTHTLPIITMTQIMQDVATAASTQLSTEIAFIPTTEQ